jgi:hypothetical protein
LGLNILGVIIHLGFGITAVLLLPQQAHEFKKAPPGQIADLVPKRPASASAAGRRMG